MRTQQSPATIRALDEEYSRPLGHRPEAPIDLAEYERSSRPLDERIAAMQGQPPLMRANGSTGPDALGLVAGGLAKRRATTSSR
jgi:hypothetical protein